MEVVGGVEAVGLVIRDPEPRSSVDEEELCEGNVNGGRDWWEWIEISTRRTWVEK